MGVTVMIIMGLLSMLAFSTLDLDLDQLQELRDRAQAAGDDDEEEFVDTSELGWLDVPEEFEGNRFGEIGGILSEVSEDDAADAGQDLAFDEEVEDAGEEEHQAQSFADGPGHDLWPLADQSREEDADEETRVADEDEAADGSLELADFNAEEDALELPYVPKKDVSGNEIAPDVSVTHHADRTDIGVGDATHSFAHLDGNNFHALTPEDILLRAA